MCIETPRLRLRRMTEADLEDLKEILQDPETMYAYEGAFSDAEVLNWLHNQQARYQEPGMGLMAVVLKETGEMIGQCGLTWQSTGGSEPVMEVGYLFKRRHWHNGYATEAARACRDYAFDVLQAPRVYSIIRDTNLASQNVARRNGMSVTGQMVKHYRGVVMPHLLFSIDNPRSAPQN